MNLNYLKNYPLSRDFARLKRVFYGLKCLFLIKKGIRLYTLVSLILTGIMGVFPVLAPSGQQAEADFEGISDQNQVLADFSTIQSNSLTPILNPAEPQIKVTKKVSVIVTGYSSSIWETDEDPYVTAANTLVRDGVAASNLLPFGAKIRLPEIFGDKIFVIEDRMNSRKGDYQIDLWFPSRWEALNFGAKLTEMEVIKEI